MIGRTNACFGGGDGGTGMNVVAGLSAPVNPNENTVWVESDKAARKYAFSETEPGSPTEGLIWFTVTATGIITKAYVYTDGAWVAVNAHMYLTGSWVQIASAWNGELFTPMDTQQAVTGGWFQCGTYTDGGALKLYADDAIWLRNSVTGNNTLGTVNPVDVTDWNTLEIEFVSGSKSNYGLRAAQTGGTFVASKTKSGTGAETLMLDISSMSGAYYIGGYAYNMTWDISRVTLKK